MSAIALDTLKLAHSLREKAKLTPEQAKGFAEAFQGDLSTKGDLPELELRLNAQIEATRTQVEAMKTELLKWVISLIGLQTIVVLGSLVTLLRSVRV